MDNRCLCSACLEARHVANVTTIYRMHRETLGVRASIEATSRATHVTVADVCEVLGFETLPTGPKE